MHASFLYVGHTHEDVDAGFSKIAGELKEKDVETGDDLLKLMPNSENVNNMLDIKELLEPYLNSVSRHINQHHYKFAKVDSDITVFYKVKSDIEWQEQDLPFLARSPTGKPKLLKSDYKNMDSCMTTCWCSP